MLNSLTSHDYQTILFKTLDFQLRNFYLKKRPADESREKKRVKSKTIIFIPLRLLSYNLTLACPTLGNYIPCRHKKLQK